MTLRAMSALSFVLALLLSQVVLGCATSGTALADDCTTEHLLFVVDNTTSASYGTASYIYVTDRTLAPNCSTVPLTWSMVNINNTSYTEQAETGFIEYWGGSSYYFEDRTAWEIYPNEQYVDGGVLAYNTFDRFKIANYPLGSSRFDSWIDLGSGWVLTANNGPDLTFTHGYSTGETGTRGDSTGALDHHKGLLWKDSSSNWYDWTGQMQQGANTISGFYYEYISNTDYEVCRVGGTCPWY